MNIKPKANLTEAAAAAAEEKLGGGKGGGVGAEEEEGGVSGLKQVGTNLWWEQSRGGKILKYRPILTG